MKKTPSELKTERKPLTDDQLEIRRWVEELKKDCPGIHPYFLEHMAKAYQANPEKFDNIIENNIKVDPRIERLPVGEYKSVNVYKTVEELKEADKLKEKK